MADTKSKLTLLAGNECAAQTCPAIYRDDEGRLFIQGNKLSPSLKAQISSAEHEEIVELNEELLAFLKTYQPE